jgi:hypothetical protein
VSISETSSFELPSLDDKKHGEKKYGKRKSTSFDMIFNENENKIIRLDDEDSDVFVEEQNIDIPSNQEIEDFNDENNFGKPFLYSLIN